MATHSWGASLEPRCGIIRGASRSRSIEMRMKPQTMLLRCAAAAWLLAACVSCGPRPAASQAARGAGAREETAAQQQKQRPSSGSPFLDKLVEAAVARSQEKVRYDPTYFKIEYPNGDV